MHDPDTPSGIDDTLYVPAQQIGDMPPWTTTYEWVTPEQAAKWLDESSEDEDFRNRLLVPAEVRKIAGYIRTERFVHFLVTEPIAFDEHGILINGKTRFNAVVEAGIPCGFEIKRDVPRFMFDYMGTGRTKNHGQVLYAHRMESKTQITAALKFVIRYEEFLAGKRGALGWRNWKGVWDQPADVKIVGQRRAEVIDQYGSAMRIRRGCKLLAVPLMVFLTYQWHAWPEGHDLFDRFTDSLADGSNMEKGSAALSLYNFGREGYFPPDGRQQAQLILLFRHFGAYAKEEKLPIATVAYGHEMLTPFHPKGPEAAKRNLRKAMVPINKPPQDV